ncbi:MAG: DNA repair protein RecN [Lachnospiraceae bacterium]|nr:DNA repair protein RecN [Ruminococcus sp.]MCM1273924.1 DNA repair protein RecN [Lachnospiraceae bacterium]
MLRELSIENLAVIENASARFGGSFNVFTGETGAGKSILIGGINAILGQRTTKDIVRTGAKKAVITALFDELSEEVSAKLAELGFPAEDELLLTREIFADGKSAARVNGRTATASMLKEIGSMLVDVHGQHENRILMSNDNQRDILDNYAELSGALEEYRAKFREFARASKRLKALQDEANTRVLKIEHLTSVVEELKALELEKGDGERLERELERMQRNADIVKAGIGAYNCLSSDGEPAASDLLQSAAKLLAGIADVEPKARELYDRLTAVIPEVNDIADEVFALGGDETELRMQELTDKVSALKHAKRKYNMDADELVDYLAQCTDELAELSSADDEIELLSEKKRSLAEEVKTLAEGISERRKRAAEKISEEICAQLSFLDMPNVRIIFALSSDKITINGRDSVELLISANAGEEPRPLNKIASGGELSRIMLAIKSVLADHDNIPTLIFDEVDAGISGRAAQKVGVKLSETAAKRQVLCITHLAQIAAKADTHLLIEKQSDGERTFTHITQLDRDGRRRELARIIDGSGESESALAAAEEMLKKTGD